ncbi:hypothetical protein BO85DRAFT_307732 [Aspergillus piperis CBS 112811]|uniref:Uncharacterized protein n=1 Tax=Aspergillus piperis CBS 112811 TaxID=1448313 RepID=A0A8G1VLB7_9EURO|nr:hypothetical protein BO85DRAFT_307732 [Aspergillus piperis CBS 112811]RAH57649.1 hypothetical protein BO85DRAFT_307732 [Aspergillus piperis CBS 112811]
MRGRSESRKKLRRRGRSPEAVEEGEVRKNEVTIPSPLQLPPNCSTSFPFNPIITTGWGDPRKVLTLPAARHNCLVRCNQSGSASLDGDRPAFDRISLFVVPTRGHWNYQSVHLLYAACLNSVLVRCCYQVLYAYLPLKCRQPSTATDASHGPSM